MVTSTNPDGIDETIQIIEPEVSSGDGPPEEPQDPQDEGSEEGVEQPTPQEGDVAPETTARVAEPAPQPAPQPAQPQVDQAALTELKQRRVAEQEQTWRANVGKAARTYQQQLEEAGYMPEQAKDQARRYVQQEQKFRKQDQEAANMIGYIQGRYNAVAHYMKEHGLASQQVIDDLEALAKTNSPAEMDSMAKRIKDDRALRAEVAQLKKGRVAPQTFDNSQGAAEATTNQDRLLDAYLAGDRSDAAVRAARNQTFGA